MCYILGHSGAREARARNPFCRSLMAYYVYLLASDKYGTLYLGVTNDVVRRVHEHKSKAVAGFTKAETERIWMPFVPLACVAAAEQLPVRRLRPVLAALAAQALVVEILFNTVW